MPRRQLLEDDGGRTALAPLDQGNHGAADPARVCQGPEGQATPASQIAHSGGDPISDAGLGVVFSHTRRTIHYNGRHIK